MDLKQFSCDHLKETLKSAKEHALMSLKFIFSLTELVFLKVSI